MRERLSDHFPQLTNREIEVATAIAKGLPNRQIAQELGLQEQSVKNLASSVMAKLDCDNRVQVALKTRGIDYRSD